MEVARPTLTGPSGARGVWHAERLGAHRPGADRLPRDAARPDGPRHTRYFCGTPASKHVPKRRAQTPHARSPATSVSGRAPGPRGARGRAQTACDEGGPGGGRGGGTAGGSGGTRPLGNGAVPDQAFAL